MIMTSPSEHLTWGGTHACHFIIPTGEGHVRGGQRPVKNPLRKGGVTPPKNLIRGPKGPLRGALKGPLRGALKGGPKGTLKGALKGSLRGALATPYVAGMIRRGLQVIESIFIILVAVVNILWKYSGCSC